ncbi:MAG: hypothetical protein K0S68_450 [Candidatus Saccharibacteria bacterium]|nr:hypothetical protein [Candidatus Saccharibacteria bacterium]
MYSQIASNKRNSLFLIIGFLAIVLGLDFIMAKALGQPDFFIPILIGATLYAGISYWFSSSIALTMAGAKEIAKKDHPELYRTVENLAIAAGLPTPKIYIVHDESLNAFASGRDPQHAVVAVTTGLLAKLEPNELEGVLAHELSHVGNYDIRFMSIVTALAAVVAVISDLLLRLSFWSRNDRNSNPLFLALGIAGAILAPLVAALIQFAVSRQREFLADASGALLTRYPEGLASALHKISHDSRIEVANSATAPLYIANPLKGRMLAGLFDTHPPIEERIKRLRKMEDTH